MEIRTNQQNLERQGEEIEMMRGGLEKEIRDQGQKIERAQRTYGSKLQGAKRARGEDFTTQPVFQQIQADVETIRHKHYLNSMSTILNEFPDFQQMIEGVL